MFVLYSGNFSHDTYNIRHTYKRNLTWDDAMLGQLTPSYLLQISKRVRFRGSQWHTHLASSSSRIWVSIGTIVSATLVWHNWGDRCRSHKLTMPHANWSMSTSSGRSSEALRTPFWGRHDVDVTGMAVACGALTTWNTWGIFELTSQCPKMAPRGTNCPISSSALARGWYEGQLESALVVTWGQPVQLIPGIPVSGTSFLGWRNWVHPRHKQWKYL